MTHCILSWQGGDEDKREAEEEEKEEKEEEEKERKELYLC